MAKHRLKFSVIKVSAVWEIIGPDGFHFMNLLSPMETLTISQWLKNGCYLFANDCVMRKSTQKRSI